MANGTTNLLSHMNKMHSGDYNPDDWPNDYSHPNAVASKFAEIEERLDGLENQHGSSASSQAFSLAFAVVLGIGTGLALLGLVGGILWGVAIWLFMHR
jgi:hypothetical protein